MYFNVYSDIASEVEGYLIPDGFSTRPHISVRCQGQSIGPIACDIYLDGPFKHRHHETGIVGFKLTEAIVPGLTHSRDLAISDHDTGFVFYRRFDPERHVRRRVFRLETQFAPHRELDRSLAPYFQFAAEGVERYGSETVRQTLEIINQPSTYVSGRVMLKSVQGYLSPDTIRIASIRDPFYELAIRLWAIAAHKRHHFTFVSERDAILFEPAMSYFAAMDLADPSDVRAKVRAAPKELLALFESPFTQQLVATSPTERVPRDGVAAALDALSQFTIFSPNETDASLVSDVSEILGIDPARLAFVPARSPFLELAETLRSVPVLEHVLENDLILFYFVKKAAARAASGVI